MGVRIIRIKGTANPLGFSGVFRPAAGPRFAVTDAPVIAMLRTRRRSRRVRSHDYRIGLRSREAR
jgi:hypothetical protein